jgi:DNA repair photolyase
MDLIEARSIFSPATGFILRGGFQWTCNPYVGCTFGCTYCYAAFLPQNRQPRDNWGRWLIAKKNAIPLAHKQAPKVAGQAVYMSSVTDPYLPIERRLMLSRGILEAMLPFQPRLVVQTRGPLVVRDIDILQDYHCLRVNVSIPTDCDAIRRRFEPKAPPLDQRWEAVRQLQAAGIAVGICVTPTLPIAHVTEFVKKLTNFAPEVLVCQDFHDAGGRFGADTGPHARRTLAEFGWSETDYRDFVACLRGKTTVFEGEAGFLPPPSRPRQRTRPAESPI